MPVLTHWRTRRSPDRPALPLLSQRYRILCVDDDDDITRIIKARLLIFQVEVSRAGSGKEGLKLAHSHRPDAIITDLGMANGDGEYLLSRLKKRPSTAGIPVIVVSGVDDPYRKAQVYSLGAAAILNKPLNFQDLHSELAVHLEGLDADRNTANARPANRLTMKGRHLRIDSQHNSLGSPKFQFN